MRARFKREINYLRISITDRCNLRCFYCMPYDKSFKFLPHNEILSYEEIIKLVRIFVELGIKYVRITGGEPLVRKNIENFVRMLSQIKGISDISLTSNGVLLAGRAHILKENGLSNINISLDSLNPEVYAQVTRFDRLGKVRDGIEDALSSGLSVKINTVLLKENFDEAEMLIEFANERKIPIRFIEMMPFDSGKNWEKSFIPVNKLIERLSSNYRLIPVSGAGGHGPAKYYRIQGKDAIVGFIPAVSAPFCSTCNRIRLTAYGAINPCLADDTEFDVKMLLRHGASHSAIKQYIKQIIYNKPEKYEFSKQKSSKLMSRMGG